MGRWIHIEKAILSKPISEVSCDIADGELRTTIMHFSGQIGWSLFIS